MATLIKNPDSFLAQCRLGLENTLVETLTSVLDPDDVLSPRADPSHYAEFHLGKPVSRENIMAAVRKHCVIHGHKNLTFEDGASGHFETPKGKTHFTIALINIPNGSTLKTNLFNRIALTM